MKIDKLINKFGAMAGWNNVIVVLLGRVLEGITELSYSDKVEMENVYGAGGMPIGRAKGNYSATLSMTLYREEVIALQQSLPPGRRIQDIEPFDIVVHYEYNNYICKDVIRNCQFTNNAVEVKQNDKTIAVKFEMITSHIDHNAV